MQLVEQLVVVAVAVVVVDVLLILGPAQVDGAPVARLQRAVVVPDRQLLGPLQRAEQLQLWVPETSSTTRGNETT